MHACMCMCVCACEHACVHACVYACVHVHVHVCVCGVCVCPCVLFGELLQVIDQSGCSLGHCGRQKSPAVTRAFGLGTTRNNSGS